MTTISREATHWFGNSIPETTVRTCIVAERIRTNDYIRSLPGARVTDGGVFPTVLGEVNGETIAVIQGVAPTYLRDALHYAGKYMNCSQAILMGTCGTLTGAVGDFTLIDSAELIAEQPGSQNHIVRTRWKPADLENAASHVQHTLTSGGARPTVGKAATVPGVSWETNSRLLCLRDQGIDVVTLDTFHFFAACRATGIAGLACQWATDSPLEGTYVWGRQVSNELPELEATRSKAWTLVPSVAIALWEYANV